MGCCIPSQLRDKFVTQLSGIKFRARIWKLKGAASASWRFRRTSSCGDTTSIWYELVHSPAGGAASRVCSRRALSKNFLRSVVGKTCGGFPYSLHSFKTALWYFEDSFEMFTVLYTFNNLPVYLSFLPPFLSFVSCRPLVTSAFERLPRICLVLVACSEVPLPFPCVQSCPVPSFTRAMILRDAQVMF